MTVLGSAFAALAPTLALAQGSGQAPKWNFHKIVVDRNGRLAACFASDIRPQEKRITAGVQRLAASR